MQLYHNAQAAAVRLHLICLCPPEIRLQGLGLVEYVVMAGAVIAAVGAAFTIFETQMSTAFTNLGSRLQSAVNAAGD